MRKYGFSHDDILDVRNMNLHDSIDAYSQRMKIIDEQIEYMTYLRHRLKDDLALMKKAEKAGPYYLKDSVEQYYVLYKEGDRLLDDAGRLDKIKEFVNVSPEVQRITLVKKEDVFNGSYLMREGWAMKAVHMDKYKVEPNEYTDHYQSVPSVMKIIRVPFEAYGQVAKKGQMLAELKTHIANIRSAGMEVDGDIYIVLIANTVEEGQNVIYALMSTPVKEI